jgi:hypothetical protein
MRRYNEDKRIIGTRKFLEYREIFAKAGERAVLRAKRQHLAITYIKNSQIIQEYPDGKKEVLAKAPKRVNVIERAARRGLEVISKNNAYIIKLQVAKTYKNRAKA